MEICMGLLELIPVAGITKLIIVSYNDRMEENGVGVAFRGGYADDDALSGQK